MAFTTKEGRTQSALSDINITPFVDVVLVLLIIFMMTAPVLVLIILPSINGEAAPVRLIAIPEQFRMELFRMIGEAKRALD